MALRDYPDCGCNAVKNCDIHDDSPTGFQEMCELMRDEGEQAYQDILDEARYELEGHYEPDTIFY